MLIVKYGVPDLSLLSLPLPHKIGSNGNSSYQFRADWKQNEHTGFLTIAQTRIVESLLSGKVPLINTVAPFAEHVDIGFTSDDESPERAQACIEIVAQILSVPAETWQFKDRATLRATLKAIDTLDKEDRDVIRRYLGSGISS